MLGISKQFTNKAYDGILLHCRNLTFGILKKCFKKLKSIKLPVSPL